MSKQIVKSSAGVLAAKAVQAVFGVAVVAILGREIGVAGVGTYAFSLAIAHVLAIPLKNGVSDMLVRELATNLSNGKIGIVRGIHVWMAALLLLSSALALTVWLFFYPANQSSISLQDSGIWGVLIAPILAGIGMFASAIRCLGLPLMAIIPDSILRPASMLLFLGICIFMPTVDLTPTSALFLQLCACLLSLLLTLALLFWTITKNGIPIFGPIEIHWMQLFKTSIPFAALGGLQNIHRQIAIIMIGVLMDESAAGILRIAVQAAMLLLFSIQAIDYVLAPKFVDRKPKNGEHSAGNLVGLSILLSVLVAVPILLTYALIGRQIIAIGFGPDFASAYLPLLILSVANLVSLLNGSIVPMLKMSGYELPLMRYLALSLSLSILLNLLLIPLYGPSGAAVASLISTLFLTVSLRFLGKKLLANGPTQFSSKMTVG